MTEDNILLTQINKLKSKVKELEYFINVKNEQIIQLTKEKEHLLKEIDLHKQLTYQEGYN
ncbi:MAG: hypothetical protein ACTSRR_09795 [Candidatus Heimdallarchaeaceae archaeon]